VAASDVPVSGDLASDTAFYRLRVTGTTDDARIERIECVVLPARSLRPQRLGGEVAVISYAGEEPLEIRFAALDTSVTALVEVDGMHVPVEHEAADGASDVYLVADPSITRIELRTRDDVLQTVEAGEEGGTVRLTQGVDAAFTTLEDNEFFRVTAEDPGSTYAALFTIHTPEHCTPVGLHRLNENGFGLGSWQSELLLMHEANGRRRTSAGGFVLIPEALEGTVRGALVRVPLRNAFFNVTSTLTYAPFWVR